MPSPCPGLTQLLSPALRSLLTPATSSSQVATGLSGCVKGLQLNGEPLGDPTQILGVTPCPSGPLQDGLFFPGGGVLTLGSWGREGPGGCWEALGGPSSPTAAFPTDLPEATLPDVRLELEVRPLAATGLVFHLGRTQDAPYLQLQLSKEQVSRAALELQ